MELIIKYVKGVIIIGNDKKIQVVMCILHILFGVIIYSKHLITFTDYSRSFLVERPFTWFYIFWFLFLVFNVAMLVHFFKKEQCYVWSIINLILTSISFFLEIVSLILYSFASVTIISL